MATTPALGKHIPSDQNKENVVGQTGSVVMAQSGVPGRESRSQIQSPRRVRDIHLDGNVDDMQNVDPYMLDETDLDIRSDVGGVMGSMSSLMSARSSMANGSRRRKPKSAGTPQHRSNAGSRARELKDHEGSPFLSIDLKQENNRFTPEFIQGKMSRSSLRGSHHSSLLSVSTSGLTSNSVRSSSELMQGTGNQRPKLFSSTSLVLPSKRMQQPNSNIKMPFKHNVKQTDMTVSSCNPSMGIKDRTARATHVINKLLQAQRPAHTTYIQGRLLKARLKPLEPVTMSTPTIHQCRGIVSETRQYGQSESRTFQRWKAIMSGGHHFPTKNFDVRDGASTSESVHLTSQTSTPEPEVDFDLDQTGLDDWVEGLGEAIIQNGIRQGMQVVNAPYSLPNSRCAPAHCDEDLINIDGPDLERMNMSVRDAATPLTDAAIASSFPEGIVQQGVKDDTNDDLDEISNGIEGSYTIGGSMGASSVDQNVEVMSPAMSKRPRSAVYPQESGLSRLLRDGRPNTAVDGSRKAVRFADDLERKGVMDMDFLVADGDDKMRKNSSGKNKNGKSSCRPHSLDSGFDDRDDKGDDDGGGAGGGGGGGVSNGRTFLTQGSDLGTPAGGQQKIKTSQGNGKQSSGVDNSSISSSSKQDISHVEQTNVKVGSVNTCLSATVCYVEPKETVNVVPKQTGKVKSGLSSARKVIEKKKYEKKQNAELTVASSRSSNSNTKSLSRNSNIAGNITNSKDKGDNVKTNESKSALCKQESCDSGVSDCGKDNESIAVSPHNGTESLQANSIQSSQTIRPISSSMKRVKAYKNIVAKSKQGNVRPYSGSLYQDVEIHDRKMAKKHRKDLRPASAVTCSEISQIQSKYGLNSRSKISSAKPAASFSSSSTTSSASEKKSQKTISTHTTATNSVPVEVDIDSWSDQLSVKESDYLNVSQSEIGNDTLRSRSATKVKFADEDEFEDDKASRKSVATSAKSYSHTSSILRGSSSSLDTMAISHSKKGGKFDEADDDYDRMWAELPDDSSDLEKNANEDNDDDCDDFMSKFDILQKQFNSVAAELAVERNKLEESSSLPSPQMSLALVNEQTKSDEEDEEEDPYYVSEEEMALIRASDYNIENMTHVFVTDSSAFDDEQTIETNEEESKIRSSEGKSKYSESSPVEFLEQGEPEWKENCWISGNLYKKTNRYVEIKSQEKDCVSKNDKKKTDNNKSTIASKIDHGQKKYRLKKGENDENVIRSSRKGVYKLERETTNPVHITIPCMDDLPFMCEGTSKQRSSRATTPIAARKLKGQSCHSAGPANDSTDSSANENRGRDETELMVRSSSSILNQSGNNRTKVSDEPNNPQSKAPVDNTPTASSSSFSSKESESTTNYYDLLLAYRSHCMEDSDDDDDEDDDNDYDYKESIDNFENAKEISCHPVDNEVENSVGRGTGLMSHRDTDTEKTNEQVSNPGRSLNLRPVSAGTTDSGLESDSIGEEGGGEPNPISDQSNGYIQTRSRPDSGISTDRLEDTDIDHPKVLEDEKQSQSMTLEVVASAKNLNKPRPSSSRPHPDNDTEKLCKLAPLCFKLNAKPPAGFLYVFAYGPNMNADRISCYLGCEKSPPRFWALLFGFGIVFNMKGTSSSEQVGGLPNLEWNPQTSVEGCIYQITQAQLERLDKFVGYPKSFEHVVLPVWMSNSLDPDALGVAQYCVPALTYIAKDKYTWTEPVPPSDYSISQCIKSADLVTPEFKGHLASFSNVEHDFSHSQLALVASA